MIKKIYFCLFLLFLCCFTVHGNKLFFEANKAYHQENYEQAIALYESLIKQYKIKNISLYYNLGNSYYRTNKIGKAILNYELALKINPRDEDTKYNLYYVKSLIKDTEETNLLEKIFLILTSDELLKLTLFFNVCFFILCGFFVYTKNPKLKYPCFIPGILLFFFAIWSISKIRYEKRLFGIVTSAPCEVRSGPGKDYTVGLSLQEGKKIEILAEQENWYAVGLHLERYKGWLEKEKIELIKDF